MYGLAYGDALGKPTEFASVDLIVKWYGPAGPRDLEGDPAKVTDDTQMALAVAWALRDTAAAEPEALAAALRRHFVEWAYSPENTRAPGQTCMTACHGLARGKPWHEASVIGSKGCGANMRVAPVGLVKGYDDDAFAGVAQLQAALTHGHPTALAASELTGYAVRVLRDGAGLPALPGLLRDRCRQQRSVYRHEWLGPLWQRSEVDSPEAYIARGWDECLAVLDRLDAALAQVDGGGDPCLLTGEGWVAEEALATAALCALWHRDDPVSALARAATTSGDSDSLACIAGALLGAAYGMAAWPDDWAQRIEYADQLAALGTAWD
jgi:ADP-ribosylglycohydrolase